MEVGGENASDEVTLFLDGGDLYVTGEADAIDLVLTELLGQRARRKLMRRAGVTRLADRTRELRKRVLVEVWVTSTLELRDANATRAVLLPPNRSHSL